MASASDLQEQELTFYSNNTHSLLAEPKSLSLIIHEPSNYPTWLVSGIAQQALSDNNECYLSPQSQSLKKTPIPTYLYSFSQTEQAYSKYFHKYITKNKNLFTFHSFLTDDSIALESWDTSIISKLKLSSSTSTESPIVILENPELLLSIVPDMTTEKLLSQLMMIQKVATLYISSSTTSLSSTNKFMMSLLHRSSMLVTLTALTTGRADDISGILSISKGPIHNSSVSSKTISDHQYSYFVSANTVKLYFK